jgi:hypothetical protein
MMMEAEVFLLLEMKSHDTPERERARPRAREGEKEKKGGVKRGSQSINLTLRHLRSQGEVDTL